MNCHTFYLHNTRTWKICLKFIFVSLIILIDYQQSLTNADILGQGNLDLVREKSGKCQGNLLSIICGNPEIFVQEKKTHLICVTSNFDNF